MSIFKNIFVKNKDIPIVIDYVQGSNSIPIELNIEDWDVPSNAEARIYIRKPSGKEIYNSVTISTNTIKIKPTTQMFAEKGTNYGQIQIIKDKDILLSFILEFDVEENIINSSAIESKDEFNVLDGLINSARIEIEKAKKATADALAAKKAADTAATNANEAIKATQTATTNANSATTNANNKVIEIQKKVDAGDFDGATFTPAVSKDGIISWQNDKGKQNPASVNIKGPKGDPGDIKNMDVQPLTFTEATNNDPIESGETLKIILGKEKKLHSRVTKLETDINGVSNRVSNLDTRVSNNADVTNRNSSRISSLESDTGWKHLSRSTNWNGADDYVVYRKIGHTVEIRFKVEPKSNWGVADSIMMAHDMPSSIIPQGNVVVGLAYHNGSAYRINIPASGQSNAGQMRIQGKNTMSPGMWVVGQVCYTV